MHFGDIHCATGIVLYGWAHLSAWSVVFAAQLVNTGASHSPCPNKAKDSSISKEKFQVTMEMTHYGASRLISRQQLQVKITKKRMESRVHIYWVFLWRSSNCTKISYSDAYLILWAKASDHISKSRKIHSTSSRIQESCIVVWSC